MSSATGYIKGACVACSGHIEFPSEAAGMKIPCPHCGRETALLDNLQPAGVVQLRVGLPPPNSSPDPGPKSNAAPAPLPRQRPPSAPASANSPSPRPQVNVPIPAAKTAAPPATAKPAPTKEPLKASGAAPKAAAAPKPAAKVSIECPSCGLEVSVRAEACPGCGAVLKEKQKFPWMAIAAGVVAIGAVVYFGSNALFKKNKPALVTWITGKFASLTGKKGGTTSPGETKPPEPATADNKPAPPPPPEPKPVVEKKAPEKKKVLSGRFELLNYAIERTPGRSLVYVVGTVTNGTPKQAFSVRVTFDLFNKKGEPVGTPATDYIQIIEPGDGWQFRALILDTNATTAKLALLDKEKDQ